MKNDLYNFKDEEYKHVINLLKELPKEKALDNFEFNLSVKIKNKNFGLNTSERPFFSPRKIFAPILGAVLGSAVLFFVVLRNTDTFENPFQIKPKLRSEMTGNIINSSKIVKSFGISGKISKTDVFVKEEKKQVLVMKQQMPNQIRNEIALQNEDKKDDFPFDKYNSTDLDEVIGKKSKTNVNRRASLASRGNSSVFFDGFYLREEVDKEYVEALKAKMDSLKHAMKKQRVKTNIIR